MLQTLECGLMLAYTPGSGSRPPSALSSPITSPKTLIAYLRALETKIGIKLLTNIHTFIFSKKDV